MLKVKSKNIDFCKIDEYWSIECIKTNGNVYEYWICHEDYRIKDFMFGLINIDLKDFCYFYKNENMMEAFRPYIENYKKNYFDL